MLANVFLFVGIVVPDFVFIAVVLTSSLYNVGGASHAMHHLSLVNCDKPETFNNYLPLALELAAS